MPNAPAAETETSLAQSEIHCQIKLPSENKQNLIVEARFPSGTDRMSLLVLKRANGEPAQIVAAQVADSQIVFEPNNRDRVAIKLGDTPRISNYYDAFDEKSASSCVQLLTSSKSVPAKPASCNAAGTPAEGWYQAGRVIQHTRNCSGDTLTCGMTPTPGWYVQKKTQRVMAKSEKCGWVREMPVCKSGSTATGWHLNDRLIARDDECSYKQMECAETGTKKEGWYVFERSSPKLLISGACQSGRDTASRDISYLAH
jgi:hypothetical protein